MKLRDYQSATVEAIYADLIGKAGNAVAVLPTGAGKTPVLAAVVARAVEQFNAPCLVLSHVKELLDQGRKTLQEWYPGLDVGCYSAGLRSRDTQHAVVVAGIQSVAEKAYEFGERRLVVIDECHLVSKNKATRYQRFLGDLLTANPAMRVIGLTATPYRLDSGRIVSPDGIFRRVCHEVPIQPLVHQGYLSPVVNEATTQVDTSGIQKRGGEFVRSAMESAFSLDAHIKDACREIVSLTSDRKAILVFTSGINHGEAVTDELSRLGLDAEFVCSETTPIERQNIIARFQAGQLRCLVNVDILTTGFDAPQVDCVAVLRATCSPGLFYQMAGRGFRIAEGKRNCLLLDYGENLQRHGPLDSPDYGKNSVRESSGEGAAPTKRCPSCGDEHFAGVRECPCGFRFNFQESQHETKADLVSSVMVEDEKWYDVDEESWSIHVKRNDPDSRTLRVDYKCGIAEFSEWICIEHSGYAFDKANRWWITRSDVTMPLSIDEAIEAFDLGHVAKAKRIRAGREGKYTRITEHELEAKPAPFDMQDCPF